MATRLVAGTIEQRVDRRDEVHYRTRGTGADGRPVSLLIVNVSAQGLMARCDNCFEVGDQVRVRLPVIGTVYADVRWSLGGRIGCELTDRIPQGDYHALLAAMAPPKAV